MWTKVLGKSDLEAGPGDLSSTAMDSPELRWRFIRKVYCIISVQLLLTVAVASVVVTVPPIFNFFFTTNAGLAVYIVLIVAPIIILFPLFYYHKKHPVNYILLGFFTCTIAFSVGLTCALTSEKIMLEAAILTSAVVVSLTLYTFWAVKRGHDFSFLGPFLFGSLILLLVFSMIQIFHPLGKISMMIYGCLASIVFCGYIVYDTQNVIKRFSYDEYIRGAVALYLDIVNLFVSLLTIFNAAD